jgi:hypothetical protein
VVRVAWVVIEDTEAVRALLWAAEPANDRPDVFIDEVGDGRKVVERVVEEVRDALLQEAEGEAGEVVALEERGVAECATCQVGDIDAGEGVDLAGVASAEGSGQLVNVNMRRCG